MIEGRQGEQSEEAAEDKAAVIAVRLKPRNPTGQGVSLPRFLFEILKWRNLKWLLLLLLM